MATYKGDIVTGQLTGKVALITGGARGIGRAAAELFAREGAHVFATDVNQPDEPFDYGNIDFSIMDVASEADWRQTVQAIRAKHGAVDILVNNAGIGGSQLPLADENVADWNRVIATNLTSVFLGMREVLPGMRAKRSGSIVNVSSIWGISAVAGAAAYHATKAAVRHLTKHAAVTYAADNVRVNSIHPGIIATPMVLEDQTEETSSRVVAATPLGRMGKPIELAKGMLFLASDESSFMTGAELVIDGGYLAQ
jgi:NAD(P)-dependent dehydrogenase (short-subunit alcohol dehydrogenase family)